MLSSRRLLLVLAVGLDLVLGEAPPVVHPVVWAGKLIAALERRAPADCPRRQLRYGAVMTALALALFVIPVWAIDRLCHRFRGPWSPLLLALILKQTFAVRALLEHVQAVEQTLMAGQLGEARKAVGKLVSRDVSELAPGLVTAAAVESLTENASDSVVAPLFWYLLGGLPAAMAYRVANTLDAMVGYHGRYEYLGKVAARLDDALNFLPARATALLLAGASSLLGQQPLRVLRLAACEAKRTASPNAGWPMGTAAVALGLRLEKQGHYTLNPSGREPVPQDLRRARWLVITALGLGGAALWLVSKARQHVG